MSRRLPRIAARLFNAPLLVLPSVAETVAAALGPRALGLGAVEAAASWDDDADDRRALAPEFYAVDNGQATIAIRGELVNRGAWLNSYSGLTSYEFLQSALRAAAADPRVERVALDIDSPGGEAAGAMETADEIRALARMKPLTAYVNSMAASAAYGLAAAAPRIVASPSATLGSIGVVWLHLDHSAALAKDGVRPTLLYAGAQKVDGNPYEALAEAPRSRIQAQIDAVYDLFTASVGKHRPRLGREGARATEAGLFLGAQAVEAGLADAVGLFPGALAGRRSTPRFGAVKEGASDIESAAPRLLEKIDGAKADDGANDDNKDKEKAAMADQAAIEAAKSEGKSEGLNEGAAAAAARIAAILDCEEAKGRGPLARHFAFKTGLDVEAAKAALAAAPAEAAAMGSRMERVPNPAVRPDSPQRAAADPQAEADAAWAAIATTLNASLPRHAKIPGYREF